MKKNLFKSVVLAVLVCCLVMLSACGGGKKDRSELSGSLEEGTFELQIFTGGYKSAQWIKVIKEFQDDYPGLNVVAYMDSDVNAKLKTRWMQNNPPDFVFMEGGDIPHDVWLSEGLLYDLTDWFKTATVKGADNLISSLINPDMLGTYNGELLQMPLYLNAYGMWYDSGLFESKEWTMPKNYDELTAFGNTVTGDGVSALCYPGQFSGYLVWGLIMPAVAAYGQEFFDSVVNATSPSVFQDQRFKDVMQRFENFCNLNKGGDAGNIMPGTVGLNHTQSQMQWLAHEAALIPNGLWLKNEMKDNIPSGFNMLYAPSPLIKADQKPTVALSSIKMAVSAYGDNQVAALEFLRYIYRNGTLADFAVQGGSQIAAQVDLSGVTLDSTFTYVQNLFNSTDIDFVIKEGSWGGIDTVFNDCVNRIVLGTMTAEQACQTLAAAQK